MKIDINYCSLETILIHIGLGIQTTTTLPGAVNVKRKVAVVKRKLQIERNMICIHIGLNMIVNHYDMIVLTTELPS